MRCLLFHASELRREKSRRIREAGFQYRCPAKKVQRRVHLFFPVSAWQSGRKRSYWKALCQPVRWWSMALASGQMDEAELWLLRVFEGPSYLTEWICRCLEDRRTGRGLRMHKEAAVWESKPEANGQDQRVCQQNVPKTYLDLTHHLGGNQTIHGGMPYPYYHVITLAPGCPSLERAGEERRSGRI